MNFNIFNINDKNVLFIHIPKTAGTSILSCLNNNQEFKIKHFTLKEYSSRILNNTYVFCVIRNPFDRFVSQWLYHTNYNDNFFMKKYNKKFDIRSYYSLVSQIKHKTTTWKSMSDYTFHKNKKIDFILRFENLSDDWNTLCKNLNFNCNLHFLKRNNREHYSNYYTPYLISKIEEMYSDDLVNFNYKFER
jgi:hypothetical protein